MILYHDTEKELFFDTDYKPVNGLLTGKAINKTLLYILNADPENIYNTPVDGESIKNLVFTCYHNNKL